MSLKPYNELNVYEVFYDVCLHTNVAVVLAKNEADVCKILGEQKSELEINKLDTSKGVIATYTLEEQ
jgi:hypothetical protein